MKKETRVNHPPEGRKALLVVRWIRLFAAARSVSHFQREQFAEEVLVNQLWSVSLIVFDARSLISFPGSLETVAEAVHYAGKFRWQRPRG